MEIAKLVSLIPGLVKMAGIVKQTTVRSDNIYCRMAPVQIADFTLYLVMIGKNA